MKEKIYSIKFNQKISDYLIKKQRKSQNYKK
jgi:hypothetical protein